LQGKLKEGKIKTYNFHSTKNQEKSPREIMCLVWGKGVGVAEWRSGSMSGGKPVFVSVICSPSARMRRGSDHVVASYAREETSFSRWSRARWVVRQVRMACVKVSGSTPHRGQVGSGLSSNHKVCAAR